MIHQSVATRPIDRSCTEETLRYVSSFICESVAVTDRNKAVILLDELEKAHKVRTNHQMFTVTIIHLTYRMLL